MNLGKMTKNQLERYFEVAWVCHECDKPIIKEGCFYVSFYLSEMETLLCEFCCGELEQAINEEDDRQFIQGLSGIDEQFDYKRYENG